MAYPVTVCPVSGSELDVMGDPIVRTYNGREVRFCCAGCVEPFERDLEAGLAKMDALVIAAQKPAYPLEVCLVSGQRLDATEEAVDHVHGNQLVRLCCQDCVSAFDADPEKYLSRLHCAYSAQKQGPGAAKCSKCPNAQSEPPATCPSGKASQRAVCPTGDKASGAACPSSAATQRTACPSGRSSECTKGSADASSQSTACTTCESPQCSGCPTEGSPQSTGAVEDESAHI